MALLALTVLLAQLFAAGLVSASHAAMPQLDAFGNVLCIGGAPGDEPSGDAPGLHECCTFGCGTVVSSIVAPAQAVVEIAYATSVAAPLTPRTPDLGVPARPARPGSPRAPPLPI